MTDSVNTRELILGILMEVTKEGSYSHLVIRSVLDKYQYLEKKGQVTPFFYSVPSPIIISTGKKKSVPLSREYLREPSST